MTRLFRLGIFVISGLVIFAGGIFLIGRNQLLFHSTYRLNAEFARVAGLVDGGDVRVAGIHKGTVKKILLPHRTDQKVRVEMELDPDTKAVLRKDSKASIRSEGLLGDEYVDISFGSDDQKPLESGDTLQGQDPVEISDLVAKANGMLESGAGALESVTRTADNLQAITGRINNGSGTLGALVNDRKVYQNMNQAASEMQEDMEAAKHNFLLSHFFHKRGYENSTDLTKNSIAKLPAGAPAKKFTFDPKQVFDKPDTAKLKSGKPLNEAGSYLQSNHFDLAVIAGYAGSKGDTAKERVLTEARAMVVRNYLVENFRMDDTRVKTIGLGKSSEPGNSSSEMPGVAVLVYPGASESH